MKINVLENGKAVTRDMTPEEEAEFQKQMFVTQNYDELVEQYIRERYSISDELALLRQKDIKQQEFSVYYEYAEECKQRAKNELNM